MRLALRNQLRRKSQVDVALLQDEIVDIMYRLVPSAVFHGGTAIWRCLQANRFSEDLDFYAIVEPSFRVDLEAETRARELQLTRFRKTPATVFSNISDGQTVVSLEIALRQKKDFIACPFERTDGTAMNVFSLSREQFIIEKMSACSNRRLIRDWYDLFFLTSTPFELETVLPFVAAFTQKALPPLDEKNLSTLVFSGAVPSFRQMSETIRRRLSHEIH